MTQDINISSVKEYDISVRTLSDKFKQIVIQLKGQLITLDLSIEQFKELTSEQEYQFRKDLI